MPPERSTAVPSDSRSWRKYVSSFRLGKVLALQKRLKPMVEWKCPIRMSKHRGADRSSAFYAVALLFIVPASLNGQPSRDLPSRVDSLFSAWSGTDRPGYAVGVSQRGRVILERGYGMANIEQRIPMTPATSVHAASV